MNVTYSRKVNVNRLKKLCEIVDISITISDFDWKYNQKHIKNILEQLHESMLLKPGQESAMDFSDNYFLVRYDDSFYSLEQQLASIIGHMLMNLSLRNKFKIKLKFRDYSVKFSHKDIVDLLNVTSVISYKLKEI